VHKFIGIRREDKNRWERRSPLIPQHVRELKQEHSIETVVQPSPIRSFSDDEYLDAGATVQDDLSPCPIIFAIKEIPSSFFEQKKTYAFFSHTIKGQQYNMPMLKKLMELECQLIEYERIVDSQGKRLIAFGKYAGMAGMIDTFWALGKKLSREGIDNPFTLVEQTVQYESLEAAKMGIGRAAQAIERDGIAALLSPLIFGIAGYGNVSKGAQEILDLLPIHTITPRDVRSFSSGHTYSSNRVYKVVFKEEDTVEPVSEGEFELHDYYRHPEKYRSRFHTYLPHLSVLLNGIYWDERYPRLVTKAGLRSLFEKGKPRLRVITDVSCDVEGSVECTLRHTTPGSPVYTYDPLADRAEDGFEGTGPLVIAVDNLPCELPTASSRYFSEILKRYVPGIVHADFSRDLDSCGLPPPIRKGVIVYHGHLTPEYRYIQSFVERYGERGTK